MASKPEKKLPNVQIIEQPAEKSFRFRYESENRNSGSIVGERSTRNNPSYPKIQINNHKGPITVFISCVTDDIKPMQHPHKLSSKINERDNGGAYIRNFNVQNGSIIEFKDIGIVFVKKENIRKSLEYRQSKKIDPTGGNFTHIGKPQLIDLHCLRLCFQVIGQIDPKPEELINLGTDSEPKKPKMFTLGCAISNKIMDKKSHGFLNIVELSSTMSQAQGGDKILLFCDRVKREDISIIFYEEEQTANGDAPHRIWERVLNYKNCKSMVVHHQYAIKFNTPSYKDPYIMEARQTFIQLHRPSDNEFSTPLPFNFVPNDQITKSTYSSKSIHLINGKRRKSRKMNETVTPLLNAFADNEAKKNDTKSRASNYDMMQPRAMHQAVNEQPLIDFSDVDNKENMFETYQMQNQMREALHQAVNRQFDLQYGHYPSNNVAQNLYNRAASSYYPTPAQPPYANGHFDQVANMRPSCNTQVPYMPTNTYHQQHQQQQPLPHTINNYANEFTAGSQHMDPMMNPRMNDLPSTCNNNFNIPPNHQYHNATTTTNPNNNRPADAHSDANLTNLSDMVQSTDLQYMYNAVMGSSNPGFLDIGRISSNLEELSIE